MNKVFPMQKNDEQGNEGGGGIDGILKGKFLRFDSPRVTKRIRQEYKEDNENTSIISPSPSPSLSSDSEQKRQLKNVSSAHYWWVIVIFLLTGTIGVVSTKVQYQLKAIGRDGIKHNFEKPLFQNLVMFVGMTLCLVPAVAENIVTWFNSVRRGGRDDIYGKLINEESNVSKQSNQRHPIVSVFLPSLCDFVATYMMNIGMLWISPSIWQLLRSSIVLWTAAIRLLWLKRKINSYEWFGVTIVCLALGVVGLAGIHASGPDSSDLEKIIGIILLLVAQLIQALQGVIEEWLLTDTTASPEIIVGYEGFWGTILCIISAFIAFYIPGDEGKGLHEDTLDSFIMLKNSVPIFFITVLYIVTIFMFNLYGMKITDMTHAVTRNVLEAVRTVTIWLGALSVHYIVGSSFGEGWDMVWSWVEVLGFLILTVGLFVYYKVIRFPAWFYYPPISASPEIENAMDDEGGFNYEKMTA